MSKILIIEPDKHLAQTIRKALIANGHEVITCGTAEAAIQKTDEYAPDIVILELQLPVHNGIEFLYELRSYDDWQNLPVIIYSQVPPTTKAISPMLWEQLGINNYHYKPFTKLADLVNSIDSLTIAAKQ